MWAGRETGITLFCWGYWCKTAHHLSSNTAERRGKSRGVCFKLLMRDLLLLLDRDENVSRVQAQGVDQVA